MSLWWPGEWDRLLSKFEDWILKKNGYSKMQPQRLSRGYQSLVSRPRTERACTTFRFDRSSTLAGNHDPNKDAKRKMYSITIQPISAANDKTSSICLEQHCINSLDKMEHILKRYERAFTKLPRRGPKFTGRINNQNLDVLNEDVIQNIFLKCYNMNRTDEIATKKF